jgi:sugar transferase (PEP-CTERM/EpsH1 system associated)
VPDILFLAHRIPYPPNKGDKIRSWHILSHLAQHFRVHLGCFVDDERDLAYLPKLKERCGDTYFARLDPWSARLRSGLAMLGGIPVTLPFYRDAGLRAWVEEVLRGRRPELIFVFSSAMAQYAMMKRAPSVRRRVVDFVDVDSDKWRQLGANSTWPRSWIYRREGRRLLEYERRVAGLFDACLFVSASEADLFRRLTPASESKIFPISNGVDFDYFSPEHGFADPYGGATRTLVFTGMMNYPPNVDAVVWFARAVLPRIRQGMPDVGFAVVGAQPSPVVRKLERIPGVLVTGRVSDVRPYLAHAAAVVAPLRLSRGIQNKVLEAMAMSKAVVCTPAALEGIEAKAGSEVIVAQEETALAQAIIALLGSGKQATIGRAARRRVQADYAWADSLRRLDDILLGDSRQRLESATLTAR